MAQSRIANELEMFQRDIRSCRALQTRINSTFQKSFEEINALTGMWSGGAHDVFMEQFRNDSENMQKLLDFLDKYLQGLEDAKNKYQRCEADVSETIRGINI